MLFSENIIKGTANALCARASDEEEVHLYVLQRAVFERSYEVNTDFGRCFIVPLWCLVHF